MARKYGKKVEKAVRKFKKGDLKSGQSGKTVKSRKQAIAIGLSEARKEGDKVPKPPKLKEPRRIKVKKAAKKKTKSASRKKTTRSKTAKKSTSRKAAKKSSSRTSTKRTRARAS